MAWVYMLKCSDESYYVGSTVDLERRIWEHQEGRGAAYTRRRRPVELVWSAACERIDEAFAFEKQIQGWSRRKREALIDGRDQDLGMLSSRGHAAKLRRSGG
jgi:putative endonuclease